jgi:hypothetical protein
LTVKGSRRESSRPTCPTPGARRPRIIVRKKPLIDVQPLLDEKPSHALLDGGEDRDSRPDIP